MSGWIAGAEVSHLAAARSATSRKLSAGVVPSSLSGTWPVPPRDRARFRGTGYTFIPSLVTAQPERGGQPGHSLANIVTPLPQSPVARGWGSILPLWASSSERKDRIPSLLKFWRGNWIFFLRLQTTLLRATSVSISF